MLLIWLRCLSPGLRNYPRCTPEVSGLLQLAVLLFQQLSGGLKSPRRIRVCKEFKAQARRAGEGNLADRDLAGRFLMWQAASCPRQERPGCAAECPSLHTHTVVVYTDVILSWAHSSPAPLGLSPPPQHSPAEQPSLGWPHSSACHRVLQSSGHSPRSPSPSEGHNSCWGAERGLNLPICSRAGGSQWHKEKEVSETAGPMALGPGDPHCRLPVPPQCQPLSQGSQGSQES
ncbi:hypothetical protein QYF61_009344 [Mycteria americana]|uniref:Uncharacterized protein n=1 Tax=Mycteria americana TaxID=33587 RepID=A0AAN7RGC5_MYCAM|nr:hypothetical protein QYF61_009344 [Mycteria americana]